MPFSRLRRARTWLLAGGLGLILTLLNFAIVLADNIEGQYP